MHTEYYVETKLHRATAAAAAPITPARPPVAAPGAPHSWFFARLQTIIDRGGFVAVDLSHTMLVHPDKPATIPLAPTACCACG